MKYCIFLLLAALPGPVAAAITGIATLPGGTTGQVQYNNNGIFSGISGSSVSGSTLTVNQLNVSTGVAIGTSVLCGTCTLSVNSSNGGISINGGINSTMLTANGLAGGSARLRAVNGIGGFEGYSGSSLASYLEYDGSNGLYLGNNLTGILAFDVNGQTRGAFTAGGNFGVGTIAPANKLHVSSGTLIIDGSTSNSILAIGTVQISSNTNLNPTFGSKLAVYLGGGANIDMRSIGSTAVIESQNDAGSGGVSMSLNPAGGNVGIGTSGPAAKIHISSPTSNGGFIIDGTGAPSTGTILCFALGGKIGRCAAPVGGGCTCTAF